jgi:hypothetical protein
MLGFVLWPETAVRCNATLRQQSEAKRTRRDTTGESVYDHDRPPTGHRKGPRRIATGGHLPPIFSRMISFPFDLRLTGCPIAVCVHSLPLQNHLVMCPLTRSRATGNVSNDLMVEYYSQRASAGLIITEGTSPSPNGLPVPQRSPAWGQGCSTLYTESGMQQWLTI